uniref:Hemocyanin n=1 Tax=Cyamus scammoni TaxID=355522 RepID=Q283K7_9CRUS|nr:hemocyanin [Cyamus scammoni]
MRTLAFCLLVASAAAWPHFFQNDHPTDSLTQRQHDINQILTRITEDLTGDAKALAESFDPIADTSIYKDDGKAAKKLVQEIKDERVLERHHWFSLFNTRQREEALMLFDVFMNCKTWKAAMGNAAYFRHSMNEGEFVYAFYAAVIHSALGKGIVLPPLYEVTPHMFTNSEVISKAYTAQMTQTPGKFSMEFTGSQKNPEQRVAYFSEDIGLNVHHVTWHMDFPFWWDDSYGYSLDRKGELFFWVHHQLTARFDAERLSNGLDLVDELYWDKPIVEGFAPHTTYRYGGEFPARPDNVNFEDVDGAVRVRDMIVHETRIRDAIAHGYITSEDGSRVDIRDENGINLLGDIIESSVYSLNAGYYGALHNDAHILLGRQSDPHGKFNLPPGVMEHFETATRDPAFFRLHKYMDGIFKEHKDTLPAYTKEEIEFSGISLEKISVDGPLETFFEDYEFDLSNAVDSSDKIERVAVNASIKRLNHKDFNLKFEINSNNDVEKHGVVRTFICPRKDAHGVIFSFEEGRWNCIELDKFWTKLAPGVNSITRSSKDSSVTVPDVPSFKRLIADTKAALAEDKEVKFEEYHRSCGIPNRLLLPKGSSEGMKFVLAVAVTEASSDAHPEILEIQGAHSHAQCGVQGEKYPDSKPMGFPLDRRIEDERILLSSSNLKYTVVKITHKH